MELKVGSRVLVYVHDPYAPRMGLAARVAMGAIIADNCDWCHGGSYHCETSIMTLIVIQQVSFIKRPWVQRLSGLRLVLNLTTPIIHGRSHRNDGDVCRTKQATAARRQKGPVQISDE